MQSIGFSSGSRVSEDRATQESQSRWSVSGVLSRVSAGAAEVFNFGEGAPRSSLSWTATAVNYFIDQPESLERELRSETRAFFMSYSLGIEKIRTVGEVYAFFAAAEAEASDSGLEIGDVFRPYRESDLSVVVESAEGLSELKRELREIVNSAFAKEEGKKLEEAIDHLGEQIFTKLAELAGKYPTYFPAFLRELLDSKSETLQRFIKIYLFKTVRLQITKSEKVCLTAEELLTSSLIELARTFLDPIKKAEGIADDAMIDFASKECVEPLFALFAFEGAVLSGAVGIGKSFVKKPLVEKVAAGLTRYRDFSAAQKRASATLKFERAVQPTIERLFSLIDGKRALISKYAVEEVNTFLRLEKERGGSLISSALFNACVQLIEEANPLLQFAINFGAAVLTSSHDSGQNAKESIEEHISYLMKKIESDFQFASGYTSSFDEEAFNELLIEAHKNILLNRRTDLLDKKPIEDVYSHTPLSEYQELLKSRKEKSREALWLRQMIEVQTDLDRMSEYLKENRGFWDAAWRERQGNPDRLRALFLSLHHFSQSEYSLSKMIHQLFKGVFSEEEVYLCDEITPLIVSRLALPYSLLMGDSVLQMERWRGDLRDASMRIVELEGSDAFLDSVDDFIEAQKKRVQTLSRKNLFSDALYRALDKKLPIDALSANIFILLFDKEFTGDFYTSLKRFLSKKDEMMEVVFSQAALGVRSNIIVETLFSYLFEPYGGREGFLELFLPAVLRGQGAVALNFAKGQAEFYLSKLKEELPVQAASFREQYELANSRLQQLEGFSTFQAFVKEQVELEIDYLQETEPNLFSRVRSHLDPLIGKGVPELVTIILHRALPEGQFTTLEEPFGKLSASLLKLTREAIVRVRNGEDPEVRAPLLLNELMPLLGGQKELTELLVPETLRGSEAMAFQYLEGLIADFLKELAPDRLPRSEEDEPVAEELYQTLLDLGVIPKEIVAAHLEKKRGVIEFLGALLARMRDIINETIPGLVSDPKAVLRLAECALGEIASYLSGEMPTLYVSDTEHQKYLAEAIEAILSPQIASLPLPKELQPSIKESLGVQIAFQIAEGLKPYENGKKLIRDLMKLSPAAEDEEVVGALESALFSAIAEKIPSPLHYLRIFVLPFIWLLGYLIRPIFRKLVAITSRPDFTSFVRYLLWRLLTFKQVSGIYSGEGADVKKQLQKVAGHFGFLGSLGAWMVTIKEGKTLPEMVAPLLKVDSTPMPVSILASLTPTSLPPSA